MTTSTYARLRERLKLIREIREQVDAATCLWCGKVHLGEQRARLAAWTRGAQH